MINDGCRLMQGECQNNPLYMMGLLGSEDNKYKLGHCRFSCGSCVVKSKAGVALPSLNLRILDIHEVLSIAALSRVTLLRVRCIVLCVCAMPLTRSVLLQEDISSLDFLP